MNTHLPDELTLYDWYTLREAADKMMMSVRSLLHHANKGHIRVVHLGNRRADGTGASSQWTYVTPEDLDEFERVYRSKATRYWPIQLPTINNAGA